MVLGVETSTHLLSLAIIDDGSDLATHAREGLVHSRELLPSIDNLLNEAGTPLKELDGIAVSLGPGSFTGLRIGLSTSKALAQVLRIPMVGIPTLDVIVMNVEEEDLMVCPLIEAGRDMVYTALYLNKKRFTDYMAISLDRLYRLVEEPTLFIGPALGVFARLISKALGPLAHFSDRSLWMPKASWVARLGIEQIRMGDIPPLRDVLPLYVKRPWVEER